nr:MAG TPA: hypothetical protein [Bacteriophage sp.]
MGFTEKDVFEAMGLTPPEEEPGAQQEPTGANEPGAAAPAAEETNGTPEGGDTGTTDGEGAEGAVTAPEGQDGADGAEDNNDAGDAEGAKKLQSLDERRAHAAARRRAEQQAAVDAALKAQSEKMAAEWKAFFESAGLKNTITGEPIATKEQFDEWSKSFKQQKLESDLKAGKLTQESLNEAISENPVVKQAAEIVAAHEREQAAAEQEKMQRAIDEQIKKIHALEPDVNGVEDLLKLPESEEFYARVKSGMSFYDAYLISTHERREKALAEAARAQALTGQRGKDHLTGAAASRGAGGKVVTSEELASFRIFNPTATDEEIRAWIEKNRN